MAESKQNKKTKTQDSFADELDSMLNLDEAEQQQGELMDDDDAIDRLLMDPFEDDSDEGAESEAEPAEVNDIDQLINEEVEKDDSFEFDEFGEDADDFFADFQIKPKAEPASDKEADASLDVELSDNIELSEMEGEVMADAEAGEEVTASEVDAKPEPESVDEPLEDLTEIDEFSEDEFLPDSDPSDFLMADFDIAPEDEAEVEADATEAEEIDLALDESEPSATLDNDEFDADDGDEVAEEIGEEPEPVPAQSVPERSAAEAEEVVLDQSPLIAELTTQLANLTAQLDEFKASQSHLKSQLQSKSNQDDLQACIEELDTLKGEQRKTKRNLDAISDNKPVSAYVANGIAIFALIVGGGLGFQGYIAKKQLAEVADYLGQLQEQVNASRAIDPAEAAEKEMLRKRLDELAQSNSTIAKQLAELTQGLQGDDDTGLGQKFNALDNQDLQMGEAIEALQNKLADLEKAAVKTQKPRSKKPAPVQENWVVNLVAYKQDWYAKRKAEEFAGKGVPAKVSQVESKGEIWYRLSVDGFKSQYDAAAYAARVKKTLNLESVWLAKVKD